eukprot:scaffold478455_cov15-Prasinocladus_malaysianus.AAC.1
MKPEDVQKSVSDKKCQNANIAQQYFPLREYRVSVGDMTWVSNASGSPLGGKKDPNSHHEQIYKLRRQLS